MLSNPYASDEKSWEKFQNDYNKFCKEYIANKNPDLDKGLQKDKVVGEDDFKKSFSKFKGKEMSMKIGKPIRDKSRKQTPPMSLKDFVDTKVKK
jgi:hypothetical protein